MAKFKDLDERLTKGEKVLKKKVKQYIKDRSPSLGGPTIRTPKPVGQMHPKYRVTGAYYGVQSKGLPGKIARARTLAMKETASEASPIGRGFLEITGRERPAEGSVMVPLENTVRKYNINRKDRRRRPFHATLARNPFAYYKPGAGGRGSTIPSVLKQFERLQ